MSHPVNPGLGPPEMQMRCVLRTKTLLSEDKSKFVVTNDSPVSVREKIKPGSRVFSHQQTFHLDHLASSNDEAFAIIEPLLGGVLLGNAISNDLALLATGSSGSGKTYLMAGKAAKGVSELAVEGLVPKILRYAVSQGCQVTLRYEEWTTRSVGRNKAPAVLAETTTTDLPIAIETFNKGERARANCQRARGNGLENGTSSRSWTSVSITFATPFAATDLATNQEPFHEKGKVIIYDIPGRETTTADDAFIINKGYAALLEGLRFLMSETSGQSSTVWRGRPFATSSCPPAVTRIFKTIRDGTRTVTFGCVDPQDRRGTLSTLLLLRHLTNTIPPLLPTSALPQWQEPPSPAATTPPATSMPAVTATTISAEEARLAQVTAECELLLDLKRRLQTDVAELSEARELFAVLHAFCLECSYEQAQLLRSTLLSALEERVAADMYDGGATLQEV